MDWTDKLDPQERAEWDAFVQHARTETVERMAKSGFVMSLAPGKEVDIKFALETGLAICMDKPIIILAVEGREIPPGLRRVAHAVIEVDDIDTEEGKAELARKLEPYLKEFNV